MIPAISVGLSGIAGWRALQRIEARQTEAVAKDPIVQRATAYFTQKLTKDTSVDDLVGDYKMLQVALGAFGLESDISSKAFIRKVLESDIGSSSSLVNRLADKRYLKFATEFQNRKNTAKSAANITDAYVKKQFELRVGAGDESYRLALNARSELENFATRTSSDKTMWYEVLGNETLRKVFEGAFGFSRSFGGLPIDRQLEEFVSASERILGTSRFSEIGTPQMSDRLITRYLAMSQVHSNVTSNRYNAALTLLSR